MSDGDRPLFLYGPFAAGPLYGSIAGGAPVATRPARLADHAVYLPDGRDIPVLWPEPGAMTAGRITGAPEPGQAARFAFYADCQGWEGRELRVETADGPVPALVYVPADDLAKPDRAPWSADDWSAHWGEISLHAAAEIMSYRGHSTPREVAARMSLIRARAAGSARAAATRRPVTIGSGMTLAADVDLVVERRPYSNYFTLVEHDLRFRRFDGTMSATLNRASFIGGDAVTVLPYDPARDRVLLIEQYRFGVTARGDPYPWLLEPVAGRIDAGETPEETVHREAMEEAGITLSRLEPIANYYPSPSAYSEYIFSFLGIADLPDGAARLGGLETEAEDIQGHLIGFETLMDMMRTGEIDTAPLIVSVQWLAANRARLRGGH